MQGIVQRVWQVAIRSKIQNASRNLSVSNSVAESASGTGGVVSRTPRVPLILGYAGTIPFFGSAFVAAFAGKPEDAATVTQLYGGSILSFLGGTHWGLALAQASSMKSIWLLASPGRDFVLSVIPSLVGFGSMMAPPVLGLPVLATSFASMWVYDSLRLSALASVPPWYTSLRTPLSIAATGACLVSWFAVRRVSDFEPPAQLAAIGAQVVDRMTPNTVGVTSKAPATAVHTTPDTIAITERDAGEIGPKPRDDDGLQSDVESQADGEPRIDVTSQIDEEPAVDVETHIDVADSTAAKKENATG